MSPRSTVPVGAPKTPASGASFQRTPAAWVLSATRIWSSVPAGTIAAVSGPVPATRSPAAVQSGSAAMVLPPPPPPVALRIAPPVVGSAVRSSPAPSTATSREVVTTSPSWDHVIRLSSRSAVTTGRNTEPAAKAWAGKRAPSSAARRRVTSLAATAVARASSKVPRVAFSSRTGNTPSVGSTEGSVTMAVVPSTASATARLVTGAFPVA